MLDYLSDKERAFVLALAWGKLPKRAAIVAASGHYDWPESAKDFLDREVVRRAIRMLCRSRPGLVPSLVLDGKRQLRPESEIPAELRPHIRVTRASSGKVLLVKFTDPFHIAGLRRLIPDVPAGA